MTQIVKVETLQLGDRVEFITDRSEWAHNCFLRHPKGVIVVAKSAFMDTFGQCRFGYRSETLPNGKRHEWWGRPQIEIRLLERRPHLALELARKRGKKRKGW